MRKAVAMIKKCQMALVSDFDGTISDDDFF